MIMQLQRRDVFAQGREMLTEHFKVIAIWAMLTYLAVGEFMQAFAQNAVGLEINMDPVFTQTNYWTAQLFPIMAIGIGISIAMALIAFIGSAIVKAFRGG